MRWTLLLCCVSCLGTELATTEDGSEVAMTTYGWRLHGQPGEADESAMFRRSASGAWGEFGRIDGTIASPYLSFDGRTVAFFQQARCRIGSCGIAGLNQGTSSLILIDGGSKGLPPDVSLSPNAHYYYSESFFPFPPPRGVVELSTGKKYPVDTIRTSGRRSRQRIADNGAVVGNVVGSDGSTLVQPNRVGVWRPGAETIELFITETAGESWISRDGSTVFIEVADTSGAFIELWRVDVVTRARQRIATVARTSQRPWLFYFASSSDGRSAVWLKDEGDAHAWRWTAGGEPQPIAETSEGISGIAYSGDGRILWLAAAGGRLVKLKLENSSETAEVLAALPSGLGICDGLLSPGSAFTIRTYSGTNAILQLNGLDVPALSSQGQETTYQTPWDIVERSPENLRIRAKGIFSVADHPFEARVDQWISPEISPAIAEVYGETACRNANDPAVPRIKAALPDFSALISNEHPAIPGTTIHTWLYGLGPLDREVPLGAGGPSDPPAKPRFQPTCTLKPPGDGTARVVDLPFVAYAPGFAGVYQVDVTIPIDWPVGVSVLDCGAGDARIPIGSR